MAAAARVVLLAAWLIGEVFGASVVPRALAFVDPVAGELMLSESLGHILTWRPLQLIHAPTAAPFQLGLQGCDRDIRCHVYLGTGQPLHEKYALDNASRSLLAGRYVIVFDAPVLAPSHGAIKSAVKRFARAMGVEADLHRKLLHRAQQFRRGQHIYPRCTELSPLKTSSHKNEMDLGWILAPAWEHVHSGGLPPSLRVVNFGCRDLGPGDPLFALLRASVLLSGLCVDVDATALEKARARLDGHHVQVVHAFVTPQSAKALLQQYLPAGIVDILCIDIDSFDASVLEAALSVVMPVALVVEYEHTIPPPFRYARLFAGEDAPPEDGVFHGASLSYLVDRLSVLGYLLYKLSHIDAVFIRSDLAETFASRDRDLSFPVDEWACYLTRAELPGTRVPAAYQREWLLSGDLRTAGERIRENISNASRAPFVLQVDPATAVGAGAP